MGDRWRPQGWEPRGPPPEHRRDGREGGGGSRGGGGGGGPGRSSHRGEHYKPPYRDDSRDDRRRPSPRRDRRPDSDSPPWKRRREDDDGRRRADDHRTPRPVPPPPPPPSADSRWRPAQEGSDQEEGELVPERREDKAPPVEEVKAAAAMPAVSAVVEEEVVDDDEDAQRLREEREMEERRRRRAEILAKHSTVAPPPLPPPPPGPPAAAAARPPSPLASPLRRALLSVASSSSSTAAVHQPVDGASTAASSAPVLEPQAVVTASTGPTVPSGLPFTSLSAAASAASVPSAPAAASKSAVDEFDMFSDSPSALLLPSATRPNPSPNPSSADLVSSSSGAKVVRELLDSWDDAEGYYKYRAGDVLTDSVAHRQFRVVGLQGSGVFSTVLRVREEGAGAAEGELVVKVIRNNETMYKAGVKEVEFLARVASFGASSSSSSSTAGPSAAPRKHIIALRHHFHHRNHLCLVFPPYAMDLRRIIKKFGSVGLSLPAVRMFGHQLLIALRCLSRAGVVHGDIKPDNILVSESLNDCALCDFGSASMVTECEVTPYLVSRFYRAPEIILGMAYGCGIDLWSVGCVLYELYTGKILFDGHSNNDMLGKVMELKGPFHVKMLRRAAFAAQHFSSDGELMIERADVAGKVYRQVMERGGTRDLLTVMKGYRGDGEGSDDKAARKLRQLVDLIHQCLTVDPLKRPTVDALLKHAFIRED